jgi:hypothetical protein
MNVLLWIIVHAQNSNSILLLLSSYDRFLLDEYDIYGFSGSVVIKAMQYALSYHMIAISALA